MSTGGIASPRTSPAMVLVMTTMSALIPAVALIVAFPQRSDYAGHFLAGAGGTALVLACVLAVVDRRPWLVVGATVLAIVVGVGTEATVFRIAIFDPVDLAVQSLGALLVGCATLRAGRSWWGVLGLAGVGVVLLVAGFNYAFA